VPSSPSTEAGDSTASDDHQQRITNPGGATAEQEFLSTGGARVFTVQTPAGRLGHSFHAPESWEQARTLLSQHPLDAAVSGGATYLMWRVARGEPLPDHLISLHRIEGHDEVLDGSVGALATLRAVERGPATGAQRALTMAASVTAGPSVRTLATLGGNLASGFPQADLVPALLALEVMVHLDDGRRLPITEVVDKGLRTDDLVTRVTHDLTEPGTWTGATVKLSRRGMDFSIATVSAVLRIEGDEIVEARVAAGSLFDRPARLREIESALVGADPSEQTIRELLDYVRIGGRPFLDDEEATAAYRQRIASAAVRKVLLLAAELGPGRPFEVGQARI
jgi:CO/xanthine dehydrogenase FAD-binding subunit